jgi:myo-inositol-1(or 4)-monophosphatase
MTMLSGEPIGYNRPDVTHGILVAAGRERHASVITHFRDHPLPWS